jgi:GntR family transcriptional repressor for pyruvate dehydrogenase complex
MPAYPRSDVHPICDALVALPAGSTASDVTTALLELFASGSVRLGERLPPERRLAEVLHVGRSAVREALATLETLGVVEARPGAGTFLRATRTGVLSQNVRWNMLIGERELSELVELRTALEIHAAWLAADRRGPGVGVRLGEHLDDMRANLDDLTVFLEADQAFHRELADATGNTALQDLLDITHGLLRTRVATRPDSRRHAELALVEHERVRAAVVAGDASGASEAMRAHMRTSAALLRESVAA